MYLMQFDIEEFIFQVLVGVVSNIIPIVFELALLALLDTLKKRYKCWVNSR